MQYTEGKVSYLYASQVLEASIALLRCAGDGFSALYPEMETFDELLAFLGLSIVTFDEEPAVFVTNQDSSAMAVSDAPTNIVELLCPAGATINNVFQECLERHARNLSNFDNGCHTQEPPTGWEIRMREQHKLAQLLLDNVDAINRRANDDEFFYTDNFLEGLVKHGEQTWVNIACDLYAKVLEIIGDNSSIAVPMVEECLRRYWIQYKHINQVDERFAASEGLSCQDYVAIYLDEAVGAIQRLNFETPEFNRGDLESSRYELDSVRAEDMEQDYVSGLERFLPTQAGGALFYLERDMLGNVRMVSNYTFTLHSLCFLYKAISRFQALDEAWPELDAVFDSFSPSGQWLPDYSPTCGPKQFALNFFAAFGMSAREIDKWDFMKMQERIMKRGKPFVGTELIFELCKAEAENDNAELKTHPAKRLEIMLTKLATRELNMKSNKKAKKADRPTSTPLDLLNKFKTCFREGELLMTMDLPAFLSEAHDLLRKIRDAIRPGFEHELWHFAMMILLELAQYKKGKIPFSQTKLSKAAEIINEHIKQHGGKLIEKARGRYATTTPNAPRLYEVDDDIKAVRARDEEKFERAGTSMVRLGKMVALYHPSLTEEDLEKARLEPEAANCINLPWYMMDDGEAGEEGNPKATVWRWNTE